MKRILCLICACVLLLSACAVQPTETSSDASQTVSDDEPRKELTMQIGKQAFNSPTLNPSEDAGGILVYDKDSGLEVFSAKEGYTDLLVFADGSAGNGIVASVTEGKGGFMPFPNGYLVRVPSSEASEIKVGDIVKVFGFDVKTNPKKYALLKGKLTVPLYYQNENRTGEARAVLYDGDFAYDSTRTNIWGVEVAVDKDGKVVKCVDMGVPDVSGNTPIPEGGYVLSAGYTTYRSYLSLLRPGDEVELIEEYGLYDFYTIENLQRSVPADANAEYVAMLTEGFTPKNEKAMEFIVDKNNVVTEIRTNGGGNKIPEGGCVLYAVGSKRVELSRFVKVGTVVFDRPGGFLCVFSTADSAISELNSKLDGLKNSAQLAKEKLMTMDFALIDKKIGEAEKALANKEFETVGQILSELEYAVTPYFAVEERAAWLAQDDRDVADVQKCIRYAKALGFNTLIVSPFKDGFALYDTKVDHLDRHPDNNFDTLQAYVEEAHKEGITVIFMLCTFCTQKPSDEHSANSFVNYFKDKLLISRKGRNLSYFYESVSYTLNPFDPEVRAFFISIMKEAAERYGVDGVQMDYIRFPLPSTYGVNLTNLEDLGYNNDIMNAFKAQEGLDASFNLKNLDPHGELWDKWCAFRCNIITTFVHEVKLAIGDVPLTCTCFADANDRRQFVYQDVAAWANDADAIYPMIYSPTFEGEKKYIDETYGIVGNTIHMVAGVGTYDGETDPIVTEQRLYAYQYCDGISVFTLSYAQNFGFDVTYKRLFNKPAVRTDLEGVSAKAYLEWMLYTVENVYAYLHDGSYDTVKNALRQNADSIGSLTGAQFDSALPQTAETLKSLANTLPEAVRADYIAKLDRMLTLLR